MDGRIWIGIIIGGFLFISYGYSFIKQLLARKNRNAIESKVINVHSMRINSKKANMLIHYVDVRYELEGIVYEKQLEFSKQPNYEVGDVCILYFNDSPENATNKANVSDLFESLGFSLTGLYFLIAMIMRDWVWWL